MALSVKRIEKLKTQPGKYCDGKMLYLQVMGGSASWLFRYRRGGVEKSMGLGPVDLVTLEQARDKAHNARKLLLAGIDPLQEKLAEKAARLKQITFEDAARQYHAEHKAKYRNPKGARQFIASLESYVFPVFGPTAVSAIDKAAVLSVLKQVHPRWKDKTLWTAIPKTASHIRGRIEAVLDWAAGHDYRSGENPARWGGHLDAVLPSWRTLRKVVHHPALPYAELPGFMKKLRARRGISSRALEFTILTCVRTNETIGALWSEIDLENATWCIPALRMKAERDHRVPLTDRAVEILRKLPRETGNNYVFVGAEVGKGLGAAAMSDVLERMGYDHVTVHGMRSSFRDWAAERTAYPREMAELALAHRVGDEVERAYLRSDLFAKRRRLAEDWARFAGTAPLNAEVVPIRKHA